MSGAQTAGVARVLAEVRDRRRAGPYHVLTLAAAGIAEPARPGQFVSLLAGPPHLFQLRRPFSVYRAGGGTVEVAFDVVGPGTAALASLRPGDQVDALGPLGRPFDLPGRPAACLLVGGGYGAAPLAFLAEALRAQGCQVDLLVGAATAARLFPPEALGAAAGTVTVTTEDGSAGTRGLVTDAMAGLAAARGSEQVYACGPMPMLAAVSRIAAAAGLPCQVAVEEHMACGTGICFSCVVPVRDGEGTRMARSCLEGPAMDGARVAWDELGLGMAVDAAAPAAAGSGPGGEVAR